MVTGSLQIKKEKYYAVLNLSDENGARRQKWVPTGYSVTGHNKRAAQKALANLIEQYEQLPKAVRTQGKVLFLDYVRSWGEAAAYTYDQITYEGYINCVNVHIIPYFSSAAPSISLQDVTPDHVQAFATHLSAHGNTKTGSGLAPKSVRNYLTVLSQIFEDAVSKKKIKENPCKNATLPKIPQREHKMFTIEQAKQFLDILDQPGTPVKYRAFFQLAIFGGFRRGEILGLEWSDIDFDTNIVHIRRTLHYSKKLGYYDTEPKSKSSVRALQLPENVIFTIKQLRNEQLSTRFKLGDSWHNTERLFTTWDGQQMSGSAPTSWLIKTCERHGLPKVNLHSMRHLNASLLISSGVDVKTVQSVLGHSQASTTLDIYAAAFRDREAQALGAVADILTAGRDRQKKNA